jgi:hypothetical protein
MVLIYTVQYAFPQYYIAFYRCPIRYYLLPSLPSILFHSNFSTRISGLHLSLFTQSICRVMSLSTTAVLRLCTLPERLYQAASHLLIFLSTVLCRRRALSWGTGLASWILLSYAHIVKILSLIGRVISRRIYQRYNVASLWHPNRSTLLRAKMLSALCPICAGMQYKKPVGILYLRCT